HDADPDAVEGAAAADDEREEDSEQRHDDADQGESGLLVQLDAQARHIEAHVLKGRDMAAQLVEAERVRLALLALEVRGPLELPRLDLGEGAKRALAPEHPAPAVLQGPGVTLRIPHGAAGEEPLAQAPAFGVEVVDPHCEKGQLVAPRRA